MSWEMITVGFAVAGATLYVLVRVFKDARTADEEGGCGKGCGCAPAADKPRKV